eukprot:s1039_g26.t1
MAWSAWRFVDVMRPLLAASLPSAVAVARCQCDQKTGTGRSRRFFVQEPRSRFLWCEEKKKVAIGIDLGTTFSCVGVWKDDGVQIIENSEGKRTTPSFVAFTEAERLVGDAAKSQAARNAGNTVFDAKRLIGRKFHDSPVVKGKDDKPLIEVTYQGKRKQFHPEEISAWWPNWFSSLLPRGLGQQIQGVARRCAHWHWAN